MAEEESEMMAMDGDMGSPGDMEQMYGAEDMDMGDMGDMGPGYGDEDMMGDDYGDDGMVRFNLIIQNRVRY